MSLFDKILGRPEEEERDAVEETAPAPHADPIAQEVQMRLTEISEYERMLNEKLVEPELDPRTKASIGDLLHILEMARVKFEILADAGNTPARAELRERLNKSMNETRSIIARYLGS